MSKLITALNQPHVISVNNSGVFRTFTFALDATLTTPGNINIGNTTNNYRAILNATNITTSDKTFTFNNRGGTLALEDAISLNAMLPSQTGNNGKVLSTDGAGTLFWVAAGTSGLLTFNGINCNTYNAQTFATTVTSGVNSGPTWTSINNNVNTHTLNIPLASNSATTLGGLITYTEYSNLVKLNTTNTFSQSQTFNGAASTFSVPPQITNPGVGTNDVVTYGQLLAARNGIGIRPPVRLLDTVSTTLGTNNPVIDGKAVAISDRVLATALATGANRIYKATGTLTSITWVIETDGQAGDGTASDGDILFVKDGNIYADQQWAYNGTTWVLYNRSAAYTFSTGLNLSGTTVTVVYGTTANTACVGNDSRLSDSRTPTAHALDNALHTISGKTAGQLLLATSPTTFAFTTIAQDLTIDGSGNATVTKINNIATDVLGVKSYSSTIATGGPTLVSSCSWAIATYRSVRIYFSITQNATYISGYIVLMHDGTTSYITYIEDNNIGSNNNLTFTTDINSGNIRLLCTNSSGSSAVMNYRVDAFSV